MSPDGAAPKLHGPTALHAAVAVWAIIGIATLVRSELQPHRANCFPTYRAGGLDWLAGRELYQELGGTCRYSPLVHAMLAPLAALPECCGNVLWRILNTTVFVGGLLWWSRATLPADLSGRQRLWTLLGGLPLAISSIDSGQSNPLMTGAMLIGMTAAVRGLWNCAALALVAACALKIYPIALALLVVLVYPRQLGPRLLFYLALGILVPFLIRQPEYVARQYQNWLGNLVQDDRSAIRIDRAYRDLWLLLRVAHVPISLGAYRVVQLAAAALAAGMVLCVRLRVGPGPVAANLALELGVCWMSLLGPASESATYIMLAPSLGWALADLSYSRRSWAARGLVGGSFALALAARAAGLSPHGTADLHAWGPHPLAALLLMLAFLGEAIHAAWKTGATMPDVPPPCRQAA